MDEIGSRSWISGANWLDAGGSVSTNTWPFTVLRLDDDGGSLRSSLPGVVGRLFEHVFGGPRIEFEWSEVILVERARTTGLVPGVRFKILQDGELKMFVLDASDETVTQILECARARRARVSQLTRRTWRYL
jgi:hypothetical protein